MITVTLLCALFTSFTIPEPWRATEVKNLEDRTTVTITRSITAGEAVTVPKGCLSPEATREWGVSSWTTPRPMSYTPTPMPYTIIVPER